MLRCRKTLLLLALPAALHSVMGFSQQKPPPDTSEVAELVIGLTNEFRMQEGRKRVEVHARLTEAARNFAGYMAKTERLSHTADGGTPATRARKQGYDDCLISENIAYEYRSTDFTTGELARAFADGWKNSPGHRKNMLDPDVTETGVTVARGGKHGHYYAVQMFGRPASQAIKFSIDNQSNGAIRYQLGSKSFALTPRQSRTHTQCRSEELKFDWPGGQQDTAARPNNGDRLTIVRSESGELTVRTQ
jgi:uncharacterized protein YkwD